jgi:putative ABC transport system permease protein
MIFNYIKIALRNLTRNKVYSLINILGLSLGVGCCLLLSLYIEDEISYDKHHDRLNDIYRIVTEFTVDIENQKMRTTSPPIALTMRDEIQEIESATRALNPPGVPRCLIKYEDKLFYETDGLIADSSLFEVLTYDIIEGNQKTALVEPNSVVISDKLSKKLFGNESGLDKIITIGQGGEPAEYKVTAVFKDRYNSHLAANFFISMSSSTGFAKWLTSDPDATQEWAGQNFVPAYVKLIPGADKDVVIKKMNQVLMKYGADDIKAMGRKKSLSLEPVKDIYLRSDVGQSPRIIYIYVIASIAVFILLIACINFMNLSTAKATKRAGEIGIRKVMGAFRSSLISQILGEAMVIVTLSLLISVIFVQVCLPFFNDLTGKSISFASENIAFLLLALAGIAIFTGLIAGSYPAFYLSSFQPAQVLKGKFTMSNSSGWLRRGLVVFQFMIAITLVCGMIIISKQLSFMQSKDLGFNSDAKIILPLRSASARNNHDGLMQELKNSGAVKQAAATEYVPGSHVWSDSFYYQDGGNMETAIDIRRNGVDEHYMKMMNIKLMAGRQFSDNRKMENESNNVIINRTSANKFGIAPEEIIGRKIYTDWNGIKYTKTIIGVMDDYHQNDLKEEIVPMFFQMPDSTKRYDFMVLDVNTSNFEQTITRIESTWKSIIIDTPFEYSFLDDNLRKQYDEDRKVSSIITSFTMIAMLISCLGLYGLSSYMAERRFKEIGVRKVMGASIGQIVQLMSKEFVKLVVVAFLISVPLAWYAMDKWLSGFAYKIEIDVFIFVYAGAAALVIALLTVSFESMKAAMSNPVESLRNE